MKKMISYMLVLSLCLFPLSVSASASTGESKCTACTVSDAEIILSYTDEDGNLIEQYDNGVEVIYYKDGDIIINDYYNVFGGPELSGTTRSGWILLGKVIFTAISVCSSIEYVTGHDLCRIVLDAVKEAYIKMGVQYDVSGNYVPGYIPGCEPRHSAPCNAGYWQYTVEEA